MEDDDAPCEKEQRSGRSRSRSKMMRRYQQHTVGAANRRPLLIHQLSLYQRTMLHTPQMHVRVVTLRCHEIARATGYDE